MKQLTDQKFWQKYWATKRRIVHVGPRYPFHDLFDQVLLARKQGSMLEVGGFPGYFAVYFAKYRGLKSTLLDYFVDQKMLREVWAANAMGAGDVRVLEQDFFTAKFAKKYDVVYSLGFLEHFDDTKSVLAKHWSAVGKGGEMLIVLPNFLGLNGHLQLAWDPKNLVKHNLVSMDIGYLKRAARAAGIPRAKVFYWGGLRVWLENLGSRSLWQKFVVGSLYVLGLGIKAMGINNKFLSPYIVIYAKKK